MKTNAAFATPALLALASLLVGSGCTSSPTPQATLPAAPAAFSETARAVDNTTPQTLATWWRTFEDPVLDNLIARAAEVNHDVRLARARLREARALAGLAAAANQPTLDATGSASRTRLSENSPAGRQTSAAGQILTGNTYRAGFDASWELDLFGANRAATAAASAEADASAEAVNTTLISVLAEVGSTYLDLRGAQRELALLQANLLLQADTAALAADRHRAGLTDFLDVLAAERARLDADQLRVQSQTATARNLIALYKALGGGWAG